MGWRADEAYEGARQEDFQDWRPALTWAEWLRWQASRQRAFALGAGATAVTLWFLMG